MYLIATFEHTLSIELLLAELERHDIPKDHILAVPLDRNRAAVRLFDSIRHSDGYSLFDLAAVLGTAFMLLGLIYGYKLPVGPIIGSIAGLLIGLLSGFLIRWLWVKKQLDVRTQGRGSEVVLMVRIRPEQRLMIEALLTNYRALGIADLKLPKPVPTDA